MYYTTKLYHHGILGQKWGVRRFQNEDGSLTDDGRRRYKQYAKDALEKAYEAYSDWDENRSLKYGDNWDKYDSDPTNYNNRMKTKKYKDLANFVDQETKPYSDEVKRLREELKSTKKQKDRDRINKEIFNANDKYWDEYFSVSEQYITEFFGKTETERNKGRTFIYDHSGLWW